MNCSRSDFYPVRIHAWGHVFPNVESAYQFKKAICNGDKSTAEKSKQRGLDVKPKESVKTSKKRDEFRMECTETKYYDGVSKNKIQKRASTEVYVVYERWVLVSRRTRWSERDGSDSDGLELHHQSKWSSENRVDAASIMEDVGVYPHVSGNILARKHIPWKNNKGMQAT